MKPKAPNLAKNKKLPTPRLATIFAWVAGVGGGYVAISTLIDPQTTLGSVFDSTEITSDPLTQSWAVRNAALSVLLIFAAITKKPLVLFSAVLARTVTELGDMIVILSGPTDNLQAIPTGLIFAFEIFVLIKLRKSARL